jgi:hypothetical protein
MQGSTVLGHAPVFDTLSSKETEILEESRI